MENTNEMVTNATETAAEAITKAAKNWEMNTLEFTGWSLGCAGLGALVVLGVQWIKNHKPEKKTKLEKKIRRGFREAKEAVTDTVEDVTDEIKDKIDEFTEE